jgi:uncharacterized protein YjbI with pentapeptide repeats
MTTGKAGTSQSSVAETKAKRRHFVRATAIVLAVMIGAAVLILLGYTQDWTGLQSYTDPAGAYHAQKTLWDWLQLFIVPAVLAGAAFWLNRSERRNEIEISEQRATDDRNLAKLRAETDRQLAEERLQDETLQAYLDKMTELLLEKGLRKSDAEDEVRAVARTRTLTVLRRLNGERKGLIVRFLNESELIQGKSNQQRPTVIDLKSANLRMVYLNGANLSGADLSGANLYSGKFQYADLSRADLGWTDLSRADLIEANLIEANLRGADLRGTDLRGADLRDAKLTGIVYDDTTQWTAGFDPIAAGVKRQEPQSLDEANADESGRKRAEARTVD